MAKPKKIFTAAQERAIVEKYRSGDGLLRLSDVYYCCTAVIRRILVEQGAPIRKRGRPSL